MGKAGGMVYASNTSGWFMSSTPLDPEPSLSVIPRVQPG
jgi:hypothetical protein